MKPPKKNAVKQNLTSIFGQTVKTSMGKFVKSMLLIFLPYFTFIIAITIVILAINEKLEMKLYQSMEKSVVAAKLEHIQAEILHVTNEMMILALNSHMKKLWENSTNIEIIKLLAEDFLNVAIYGKLYDQVRLINENGLEMIRVNFNNGNPEIVPYEKLQNKRDRYYFHEAIKLKKNEVYISSFDLNIEHGEIEKPFKPMIRFATPVFDQQGVKRGIVLLNYLGQKIINQIVNYKNPFIESRLMLLNNNGYWLKGPTSEYEWGFMFQNRKDMTFANIYTNTWPTIKKEESSQFINHYGMFTFKTIHPLIEGQRSIKGSDKEFSSGLSQLTAKKYYWKIISYVPSEILYAKRNKNRKNAALILAFLSINLLFISWKLTKTQYSRIKAQRALKESEQELRELNVTKDKFFSIIAHDLKSPFASLLSASELLLKNHKKYDETKREKFIKSIYRSSSNIYKLVENLLLWSRTQSKGIKFKPEDISISKLINENSLLFKNQVSNKKINLITKYNENLFAYADPDMINSVMRNLISNAIKFTPNSGEVKITAINTGDFHQVSIKDTGVGISKENISKLFRIDDNYTTEGTNNEQGTGLGLILCKEFIEKHGGKIWVESKVGEGSEFSFTMKAK